MPSCFFGNISKKMNKKKKNITGPLDFCVKRFSLYFDGEFEKFLEQTKNKYVHKNSNEVFQGKKYVESMFWAIYASSDDL